MGANSYACQYLSTTGAGVAIGTGGIQFFGFVRGSDLAGTIIIKDSATVLITNSATAVLSLASPLCLRGPVTMTSSAGDHYVIMYRDI